MKPIIILNPMAGRVSYLDLEATPLLTMKMFFSLQRHIERFPYFVYKEGFVRYLLSNLS